MDPVHELQVYMPTHSSASSHSVFSPSGARTYKSADPKQWCKLVKSVTDSSKTSAIPPLFHDGQVYNQACDKSELLKNTFAANAQVDDGGKRPKLASKTSAVLSSLKFQPKKVYRKLHNLDTSKANGPDGISATVLKNYAPELALIPAKLFQLSVDTK